MGVCDKVRTVLRAEWSPVRGLDIQDVSMICIVGDMWEGGTRTLGPWDDPSPTTSHGAATAMHQPDPIFNVAGPQRVVTSAQPDSTPRLKHHFIATWHDFIGVGHRLLMSRQPGATLAHHSARQ